MIRSAALRAVAVLGLLVGAVLYQTTFFAGSWDDSRLIQRPKSFTRCRELGRQVRKNFCQCVNRMGRYKAYAEARK